jgi:Peptidase M10 serralysin C terminal/FG-GAP-like repeat
MINSGHSVEPHRVPGLGHNNAFSWEGVMPTVNYTADQAAAQITRNIGGYQPALGTAISLTYAYRSTFTGTIPNGATGFTRYTGGEIGVSERAFQSWSDVANITFNRVGSGTTGDAAYSDTANLLLANFTGPQSVTDAYGGFAYRQYSVTNGVYTRTGQVWLDGTDSGITSPVFPNFSWRLQTHEIGHAIGLSHPGNYDISTGPVTYANSAVYIEDSYQYSIMSYFDETNTGANFGRQRPLTPMMHDIAAIQRLYGANYSTRSGDTIYGFNSNTGDQIYTFYTAASERVFCIWDGGGIDTIDASGYSSVSFINLAQGSFSNIGPLTLSGGTATGNTMTGNISIAYGAVIENAIGGSGNDALYGNSANNTLTGNGGANTLAGLGGRDVATYNFASTGATLTRTAYGAATVVGSGVSDTLSGVEVVRFTDRTVAIREAGRSDISGDGAGDIVWFNPTARAISYYELNPAGGYTWHNIGGVGAGYTPLTGDFNGDGRADIFWSNGTNTSTYLENADGSYTWRNYGSVSPGYTPLVGDFNGDGISDVMWSNGSSVSTYLTTSTPNASGDYYTWRNYGSVSAGYTPYVGDFNGDGISDVMWTNGSSVSTYLTRTTANASGDLYTWRNTGSVGPGYTALIGDFSGDGTSDIAWWNESTGAVSYYEINPTTGGYTWHNIGAVGAGYTPFVRDFNNDGKADIGWTGNGSVSYYDINSPSTPGGGYVWRNIGAVGAGYNVVS